ncbi:hypothetical protein LOTGIDRAFT_239745 [Lottia gigantea]|uniref:Uncharacterized protein n=1 Tax=Lottia gigantea TaxID=225164 RepID=V4A2L9_LOTGI|nr:hypothetical protein LOTGIDRAFT_239745 [Lottia gigantea]ESO98113.1 hypothetical protein LOTGIDRAFT_239745 [Lottia gigantea]
MSGDNKWTLNKDHIRLALRKVGVEAEQDTITLLHSSITEPQEFKFEISVMGLDPITVDGHIYLVYKNAAKNMAALDLPPVWKTTVKKPKDSDQLEAEGSERLASDTLDSDSSSDDEASPKLSKDVDYSKKLFTEDESPEDPDKK